MYKDLQESLIPKIGKDAATAGIRSQYASLGLVLTSIVVIGISNTGDRSWFTIWCLVASVILAGAGVVYTKMLFARAISKYIGIKIHWFGTPTLRSAGAVDEWLRAVKQRSKSSS